ncbi:MAG: methyltransferase type 12 [Deltaproteobacteria bacterium RBG_19FT_COMBO_60_16]|nr:MAG: methyltransferase type 12 [Deltaproteobacteria bacterium RBG_19FT_COMBO_60_16]
MSAPRRWEGHEGPVLDSAKGFDVIECGSCGFRHLVPLPTMEELEEVYRQEYYAKEKPLYLDRHREDLEWWTLAYGDRYDTFEGRLPPHRRRILDIGSGPGFFLLCGKSRGWATLGIEPSAQAAEHARGLGLEVVEKFLTEESAGNLGHFDAIHMSEVLEHIPDAAGMLTLAKRLLSPGGMLCVVVPNDYSPFQHALRSACGFAPWWVAPPHHVNYFDFDSLSRLLDACGFETVLREATFPIDLFLLMGDNYVGDDLLGRQCHGKRKALELTLARAGQNEVRRALYRAFAENGIGREAVVFARGKG